MRPLIVIRRVPRIDFMRWHLFGFAFSLALTALTIGLFFTVGLNYGIDFVGGTLIEARTTTGPQAPAAHRQGFRAPGLCSRSAPEPQSPTQRTRTRQRRYGAIPWRFPPALDRRRPVAAVILGPGSAY